MRADPADTPIDRLRGRVAAADVERSPADKLAAACDLFDTACELRRAKLRRAHPDASEVDITRMVDAWLAERPGAEDGDGSGVPGSWPRTRTT